jgi:glycosyltransferase involved in cell wall biosynthesis
MTMEMRKKKIAILTNYPSDHSTFSGGVETATVALLEGLRNYEDEFEFHVVSVSKMISSDIEAKKDGVWFHFISVPGYAWLRPRFSLVAFKTYRKIRDISPDLIHCQGNMMLAFSATFIEAPRLFTIHGVVRDELRQRRGWEFISAWLDVLLEKYAQRHYDAFICISNYSLRIVDTVRPTYSIPNAVRSLFFQGPEHLTPPGNPNLVFAGGFAPLKRPSDLLLAHAELRGKFPHLQTLLCGGVEDVGYAQDMFKMVSERRIEGIRFLGSVKQEELADLLKQASSLVVSSAQENTPMVIAEAMAVGVPVVATRVGGIPDMVRDGETGLLYEPGDVKGLVNCLMKVLSDSFLWKSMSGQAREIARCNYSAGRVAKGTIEAYRRLLNEAHG